MLCPLGRKTPESDSRTRVQGVEIDSESEIKGPDECPRKDTVTTVSGKSLVSSTTGRKQALQMTVSMHKAPGAFGKGLLIWGTICISLNKIVCV